MHNKQNSEILNKNRLLYNFTLLCNTTVFLPSGSPQVPAQCKFTRIHNGVQTDWVVRSFICSQHILL